MARRNRTDQFLKYREAFRAHGLPSSSKSHEMQELKGKAKLLASGIAPVSGPASRRHRAGIQRLRWRGCCAWLCIPRRKACRSFADPSPRISACAVRLAVLPFWARLVPCRRRRGAGSSVAHASTGSRPFLRPDSLDSVAFATSDPDSVRYHRSTSKAGSQTGRLSCLRRRCSPRRRWCFCYPAASRCSLRNMGVKRE